MCPRKSKEATVAEQSGYKERVVVDKDRIRSYRLP